MRLGRPGERQAHQVSTAHFQAAYPAVAEPGLGPRGVYIGRDMHGGSFVYDPWILYAAGVINDPNMMVIGRVGHGKSALVEDMDVPQPRVRPRLRARRPQRRVPPARPPGRRPGAHVHPRRPDAPEPADAARDQGDARRAARGDRPRDARAARSPSPRRSACPPRSRPPTATPTTRTSASPTSSRSSATPTARPPSTSRATRARRRPICGSARSRCSASPTARCEGCSTSRRRPASRSGTRPRSALDLSQIGAGQAQSNLAIAIVMVCAVGVPRRQAPRPRRTRPGRRPGARQDDPGQRRVLARPADPRPRRVLPVRVQAHPADRGAAHPRPAPPL